MYFACLEALQNAAKYAGRDAVATVVLSESDDGIRFTIDDDGAGFDPATAPRGAGLANIVDRLGAVGGTVTIDSASGPGTHVRGRCLFRRAADRQAGALPRRARSPPA